MTGISKLAYGFVVAVVLMFVLMGWSAYSYQRERNKKPCSEFGNETLDTLPVRCLKDYTGK